MTGNGLRLERRGVKRKTEDTDIRQPPTNTHGTAPRANKGDRQSPPKKNDLTNEEKHSGMSEASHERNLRQQQLHQKVQQG